MFLQAMLHAWYSGEAGPFGVGPSAGRLAQASTLGWLSPLEAVQYGRLGLSLTSTH